MWPVIVILQSRAVNEASQSLTVPGEVPYFGLVFIESDYYSIFPNNNLLRHTRYAKRDFKYISKR